RSAEAASILARLAAPPPEPASVPGPDGLVHDCRPSRERLRPLRPCMGLPEMAAEQPGNDWPSNVISNPTLVYSCGMIARAGACLPHHHDPHELDRCRQLANEAMSRMQGWHWPEDQAGPFLPFSIAANVGDAVPHELTEAILRERFHGVIRPGTWVRIQT